PVLPVAHLPLDQRDDPVRAFSGSLLGGPANDDVVLVFEVDHRRHGVGAIDIAADHCRPAGLVDVTHDGVGGPEVDAEDALLRFTPGSFLSLVAEADSSRAP